MSSIPTPHINAEKGDFAPTVLMPGDPLRAQFIAKEFLSDARLVNNVRGVNGYTGTYRGKPVSVMASGMGMPAISIYSYELYNFYDVKTIIRVGSAGALTDRVKVRDLVIAEAACYDSSLASQFDLPGTYAPSAPFHLLVRAKEQAETLGLGDRTHIGTILSSDKFYDESDSLSRWRKMGVLAVEMEAAALYMNAARSGKDALCICTISDSTVTGEACSAEERQNTFGEMIALALALA